jgi:hypothetical protein
MLRRPVRALSRVMHALRRLIFSLSRDNFALRLDKFALSRLILVLTEAKPDVPVAALPVSSQLPFLPVATAPLRERNIQKQGGRFNPVSLRIRYTPPMKSSPRLLFTLFACLPLAAHSQQAVPESPASWPSRHAMCHSSVCANESSACVMSSSRSSSPTTCAGGPSGLRGRSIAGFRRRSLDSPCVKAQSPVRSSSNGRRPARSEDALVA